MRRPLSGRFLAIAALCGALAATPVRAASDLDLLSNSVPPNLMILFDTSGSMTDALPPAQYFTDPDGAGPLRAPFETFQPSVCTVPQAPAVSGTEGRCPGGGDPGGLDRCPDNYNYGYTAPRTFCGIVFPDLDPSSVSTWYYYNYLNWVLPLLTDGNAANDPPAPTQNKLMAAKTVVADVINAVNPNVVDDPSDGSPTYTERVRFGLSRFASSGSGGYVTNGIADGNKSSLLTTLAGLPASGGTPLSESLVDVGRYFAGEDQLGTYTRYNKTTGGATTADFNNVPQTPMDVECRQSFVLIMTDGEPSSDQHTATYQAPFLSVIGNADGDANECSLPAPATCTDAPRTGRDDGLVYIETTGTDWLDDVSYHLYENDLIPDATLEGTQNLVTYTVGFVLNHPLLSETATNGHGTYFTTTSASQLGDQIEEAVLDIIERSSSFTSTTVPANRSAHGAGFFTAFFDPTATGEMWEGHLEAYRLTYAGDVQDATGAPAIDPNSGDFYEPRSPFWDAGEVLAARSDPRLIYATRSGARAELLVDDPLYTATTYGLDAGELGTYPNYPASGVTSTALLATAITNYLHGRDSFDDDNDGDFDELRPFVLGDVFHSTPVVVGPPSTFLATEAGYGTSSTSDHPFRDQFRYRDRVLYTGANDGMLHAFHAGDWASGDDPNTGTVENGYYTLGSGQELFAYVPGMLLGPDPAIGGSDPNHFSHVKYVPRNEGHVRFFVDAPPVIADAWLGDPSDPNDTTKTPDEWKTVLLTGLREGGKGYLALDVTDPDAAPSAYPGFLWEFTHAQLGESWSEPIITRVKRRAAVGTGDQCGANDGDGDCREEWVAIFGAGYEDMGNPNTVAYASSTSFSTTLGGALTASQTGVVAVASTTGLPASGSFRVRVGTEEILCSGKSSGSITIAARGQSGTLAAAHSAGAGVTLLASDATRGRGFFMVDLSSGAVLDEFLYDATATDGREDLDFAFPSRPAVLDMDFDGFADVVYIGDLGGQLWKWDVSAVGEDQDGFGLVDNWSAGIFFAAAPEPMGAGGTRYKSLFFPPAATLHGGTLVLAFGTGERHDLFYQGSGSDDENNRFYVVDDAAPTGASAFPGPLDESDLSDVTGADSDTDFGDSGFFFVLQDGEKFITNHTVFAGYVITASYAPDPVGTNICERGGSARLYVFSVTSGLGFYFQGGVVTGDAARRLAIGAGAPSDPRLSISPGGNELFVQTSEGEVVQIDPPSAGDLQRTVYWRTRF
jgi:Tfp pilus tip-associated adhesin PilY1